MMSWRHRNVLLNLFRLSLFLSEKKRGKTKILFRPKKKDFTLPVSFSASYTEDEPDFRPRNNFTEKMNGLA